MHHETHSATPYDMHADAMAAVDAAMAQAQASGRHVLLVMGANWCHDSRGLAGLLETPRFAALVDRSYVPVFIDAGKPREDAANNMEVARRFGVDKLIGTPNVFILTGEGERLNPLDDVTGWTDAASRDEDTIYAFLAAMAPQAR
ncbi:thioredoxin family protein [Sphingomicrobium marinum]|uniref:thioredoxin family protein n=1 Tax=Sphingomicrobium marinum TaxID=1227950 RepID=UPI00223E9C7B|nr:thioredoxin family protein [Sphingomicrobium marinum]